MRKAIGLVCGCLLMVVASPAWAASTLTVQSATDDAGNANCPAQGSGFSCPSLRDAIDFADNGNAGANPTVQLGSNTYTISHELIVSAQMTITGTGSSATIIEETADDRVIEVKADAPSTLQNLEITNGNVTAATGASANDCTSVDSANGGGICSLSPLTVSGVLVTGNTVTGAAGAAATGAANGTDGGNGTGSAIAAFDGLTLTNSTVSGNHAYGGAGGPSATGFSPGSGGSAAGAVAAEPLTMTGSTVTLNTSTGGTGGNGNEAGGTGGGAAGGVLGLPATIDDSVITNNIVTGGPGGSPVNTGDAGGNGGPAYGGGLVATPASVSSTVISGNKVTGGGGGAGVFESTGGNAGPAYGGGLFAAESSLTSLTDSTVSDNSATAGAPGPAGGGTAGGAGIAEGGGIADGLQGEQQGGPLTVSGTTISGNMAVGGAIGDSAAGGGIAATDGATATVVNSTLFDNQANGAGFSASYGGAIHADSAGSSSPRTTVTLANDTLFDNQATKPSFGSSHGGTLHAGDSAIFKLQDTILAGTSSGTPTCALDSGASITDLGHNLEDSSPSTCNLTSGGATDDLIGQSPKLPAALGANGGPTQTLALGLASPAIGAGGACTDPTLTPAGPLTTDQRGDHRGSVCDIGAFQTEPISVTGTPKVTGTAAAGSTLTCAAGTFAATGDGPLSASGAVGAPAISHAWLRDGTPIGGATSNTYKVASADKGHKLACKETATGAYGAGSATSASVAVSNASAPRLSKVSQAQSKWRDSGRKPLGTSFKFTLSESAKVTLTFTKPGKRHKSTTVGTLTLRGKTGKNKVSFSGKLHGHKLKAGSYSVTFTASANGQKSRPSKLTFKIIR